MDERLRPESRPSKLSGLAQAVIGVLLLCGWVSGLLLWWGEWRQGITGAFPAWHQGLRIFHGLLNPVFCVLLGWLLGHHIRVGWRLRANLVTGITVEVLFVVLVASGVGIYYAGSEWGMALSSWAHRVSGVLLPAALLGHGVAGRVWGGRVSGGREGGK